MIEKWKTIKDFPDYMVSDQGNIKSFKKWRGTKERILEPGKDSHGYLYVNLHKNGKQNHRSIHRLVLEAFEPKKDMDKSECNHKDGNKERNIYPDNLEWCTHLENMEHAKKSGLMLKGKNHPFYGKNLGETNKNSKLTEKNVIKIRIDLKEGKLTQKEIGEKFGVKQAVISSIKLRKIWKHIK